jgi:hypothetical protein
VKNRFSGEICFEKALVYTNLRILPKSGITRETHSHAANAKLSENVLEIKSLSKITRKKAPSSCPISMRQKERALKILLVMKKSGFFH